MDEETEFNPDDLEEMARRLEEVSRGESEGYEMTFYISHNDAMDLLDAYNLAVQGEPLAMSRCWVEFSKIMMRLETAMDETSD